MIPVKRLSAAKSRLRGAVPGTRHAELALAMVCDTATAVLAAKLVDRLVVITDDPVVTATVQKLGAAVVPDRPGAGLNAAMRFGADEVAGLSTYRVVLAGDLPALRPEQLDQALAGVNHRGFVADAAGTGTVLLASAPGQPLDPRFGLGSAQAHADSGAVPGLGAWPGLRQDVDTPADLDTVVRLGVGRNTCMLLRDLGLTTACAPAA